MSEEEIRSSGKGVSDLSSLDSFVLQVRSMGTSHDALAVSNNSQNELLSEWEPMAQLLGNCGVFTYLFHPE